MSSIENKEKILLIRMQTVGDVSAIGLPAIRFFEQKFPQAELHFLTFGQGKKIIQLAQTTAHVLELEYWADDFFQAMEAFLGLAETIVGEGYQQIVNLDTAFMPCFLGRFLKDAGEPVRGNYLSISIQQLLDHIQTKSLQAEYVNVVANYMQSSFFSMNRWHSSWWESSYMPDGGYPEFYLRDCCGFEGIDMNAYMTLTPPSIKQDPKKKVISLAFGESEDGYPYPYTKELTQALRAKDYVVNDLSQLTQYPEKVLNKLSQSALMVAKPSGMRWLANHVACPVLLVSGAAESKAYMPDFATDISSPCPRHANANIDIFSQTQSCNCEDPQQLADNIAEIITLLAEQTYDA